jgi:hypothetical protein
MNKGSLAGQIFLGFIVVVAFLALGSMQLNRDRRGDSDLLNKVQMTLMTEYFPDEIANVKKAGSNRISAGSIILKIKEINASYPVYTRSRRYKTGVVKVTFVFTDSNKIINEGISFYRFSHSPIRDKWEIKGRSNKNNYFFSLVF